MPQPESLYVGIDLAIAKKKILPIVVCHWQGNRCVPLPLRQYGILPPRGPGNAAVLDPRAIQLFVGEARQFLIDISNHTGLPIGRIAIDAPRAPASNVSGRRSAERAMDRAGISCFTTPSGEQVGQILAKVRSHLEAGGGEARLPHANQIWMIFGFELYRTLSQIAPCIEVYPQLTVQLMGVGQRHKSQPGAVAAQFNRTALHTGWPVSSEGHDVLQDIGYGASHDLLDAYLAAWVAALPESKRIGYGQTPDDVIWAPMVDESRVNSALSSAKPRSKASVTIPEKTNEHALACPACGNHVFKRWPFGWDAHAAYRCDGIDGASPEERKRIFKRTYSKYFS